MTNKRSEQIKNSVQKLKDKSVLSNKELKILMGLPTEQLEIVLSDVDFTPSCSDDQVVQQDKILRDYDALDEDVISERKSAQLQEAREWNMVDVVAQVLMNKKHPESPDKESVRVLKECIELQLAKSQDYQNPNSSVQQKDYYPSGLFTIQEIIHAKLLRMRSVMEAMRDNSTYSTNFESLEDSAKDAINYLSFFVSYCRGQIDGQNNEDIFK